MIKKTVKYTTFDGEDRAKDLWFHIFRANILALDKKKHERLVAMGLDLTKNAEQIEQAAKDADVEDPSDENTKLLIGVVRDLAEMIDIIVDLAYGVRQDEETFIQEPELTKLFKNSIPYKVMVAEFLEKPEELQPFVEKLLQ
jgi:hypothetical protein